MADSDRDDPVQAGTDPAHDDGEFNPFYTGVSPALERHRKARAEREEVELEARKAELAELQVKAKQGNGDAKGIRLGLARVGIRTCAGMLEQIADLLDQ